jgi:MgtC family
MSYQADMLVRLAIGTLLGAVIGYERYRHGRPAGLRTHLIVALASTAFMLASTDLAYFQRHDGVTVLSSIPPGLRHLSWLVWDFSVADDHSHRFERPGTRHGGRSVAGGSDWDVLCRTLRWCPW